MAVDAVEGAVFSEILVGWLGEFERFRFIGSPIAGGRLLLVAERRGRDGEGRGGWAAQEVKLDGMLGNWKWRRGRTSQGITSAPRSALEHSAATSLPLIR